MLVRCSAESVTNAFFPGPSPKVFPLRPAIIVLAAGLGSRFDAAGHKLAQDMGLHTVLATTLANAVNSGLPVTVVTTEALADLARPQLAWRDIVVLPQVGTPGHDGLGMGYSIAAGVSARPDAPGWMVLPADMPLVRPDTLQAVARQLEWHPVVYAQYQGRRGHPVGFASELYSELVRLSGDDGARRLVGRYPAYGVDVDDAGVLLDVDTPADLERARRLLDEALVPVKT